MTESSQIPDERGAEPPRALVRIFDTTLRDGEQAPGCTMSMLEKLDVARQLARLRVDVIEAGFPASSADEQAVVARIAAEVGSADGPIICGLARATKDDIAACAEAVAAAARRRIHTFIATSDLHLEHKLRISRDDVLRRVDDAVSYARSFVDDVEFSPEDASRSDPEFLCEVLRVAVAAGASTMNIPDTVGYSTPTEYGALIGRICAMASQWPGVIVSTHCHDDLGLATANSLAGVAAGARQIECTVNGIGERAGNAALEEVVMAMRTRSPFYGLRTNIAARELARASRLVSMCTGVHMPPNKAIVGANAFAHESGIHQDGMLKHRATYEIMTPESVGVDGTALVLGKHSGRRAVRARLEELGLHLGDDDFALVFQRFKELATRKKSIDERDLLALAAGQIHRAPALYELVQVQVASGTHTIATATVRVRPAGGDPCTASATGTGPVDAVCRAIDAVVGGVGELRDFTVRAVTEGIAAVGEVTIRMTDYHTGRVFVGHGTHTDIITASAEAYIGAVNRLLDARGHDAVAGDASRAVGPRVSVPTPAAMEVSL